MDLNPAYFEPSSEHYFIPLPSDLQSILYYPISVGYLECKPSYHTRRNNFNSYLLICMLSGQLSFQTRKTRGVARVGQTLLLDCNEPHSYAAQGRCSFTFVHFDGAQSREIYETLERSCGNLVRVQDVNRLHEALGEMMDQMRLSRRVNEAQTSALLYGVLMQLLQASGTEVEGSVGNAMVDQAISYIREHLSEKLSVEALAAHSGYSANYFSSIFTRETGMSPYQFVVRSRLELAQQLLKTTELTVQEIAFQAGFNSAANFCYAFRRELGCTPNTYRLRPI